MSPQSKKIRSTCTSEITGETKRALKRSSAATYSPSGVPSAKASRIEVDAATDVDMPIPRHNGPGPETMEDAMEDATSEATMGDSDLMAVDQLIAARAILGGDMTECISDETAKRIASECHKLLSVVIMQV